MARTNKYTSLNFNDIYEKKTTPSSSPSSSSSRSSSSSSHSNKSYSFSASSRVNHGGMLVLSRPSPKSPTLASRPATPPDSISLRPQGNTGSTPALSSFPCLDRDNKDPSPPLLTSPKSNKFVPPHLRPGYVPREKKMPPGNYLPGSGHGHPGEDGRPKSGGGYDRRMKGVGGAEFHPPELYRPRSGGNGIRPSSTG